LLRGQRLIARIRDEIDPQIRVATPEGDIAIAMTLSQDMEERAYQMRVFSSFLAWKTAPAFTMTSELHEPDAIVSIGVSHKETLAVLSTISRKPLLRFGEPQWLSREQIGDDVPGLLPRGAIELSKTQIAEIDRFFGPTGLFPAVKIGNE
jgi:hypothetical protein